MTAVLPLLRRIRTIAIVGASSNPSRASFFVATYLRSDAPEYTVWYVNPRETEILGSPVYASLGDLPAPPDLVDVFRRADDLPGVVDESIAVGASAVWFQLGLVNDVAAATAEAAGLDVVQDKCLKIEHARFSGNLATGGFDTGVISARRRL